MRKMATLQASDSLAFSWPPTSSFSITISLIFYQARFCEVFSRGCNTVLEPAGRCVFLCHEGDIISGKRTAELPTHFPHSSLRPVSPNSVPQFFTCYKSNTTLSVVLSFVPQRYDVQPWRTNPFSLFEKASYLDTGFDRPHDLSVSGLDGQALASFGTTAGEYRAAALGGHTGTKTMAFGTLASVRLVGALHTFSFQTF